MDGRPTTTRRMTNSKEREAHEGAEIAEAGEEVAERPVPPLDDAEGDDLRPAHESRYGDHVDRRCDPRIGRMATTEANAIRRGRPGTRSRWRGRRIPPAGPGEAIAPADIDRALGPSGRSSMTSPPARRRRVPSSSSSSSKAHSRRGRSGSAASGLPAAAGRGGGDPRRSDRLLEGERGTRRRGRRRAATAGSSSEQGQGSRPPFRLGYAELVGTLRALDELTPERARATGGGGRRTGGTGRCRPSELSSGRPDASSHRR